LELHQKYPAIVQRKPGDDQQRSRKTPVRLRLLVSPRHGIRCAFRQVDIVGNVSGKWESNQMPGHGVALSKGIE
jgi:hypothetical protein